MAFGFDQLRTFIHIAELGSFTAAADKAGVTQPAVSLQIKLLEQRLGVRLIERVGRRAQPTAAGLEFLDYARRIMRELADAEEAMAPHRNGESGRVRIGSGATASIHLLPLAISRARKKMPGLEITVRIGNTDDILRDLETNALDVAVVTLPAPGRSFEVEAFYDDELMVVAPRGSAIPHGGPDAAFIKPSRCCSMTAATRGGPSMNGWGRPVWSPALSWSSAASRPSRNWWRPASAGRSCPAWR